MKVCLFIVIDVRVTVYLYVFFEEISLTPPLYFMRRFFRMCELFPYYAKMLFSLLLFPTFDGN